MRNMWDSPLYRALSWGLGTTEGLEKGGSRIQAVNRFFYCKWQLQSLKHIMRARLCWQRHFPSTNTGRRHSTCGVPSHGKLNAALMSILREDWMSRQLGTLWDKLLPNLCSVTCKATCTVSRAVSSCWAKIQGETWICTKKGSPGLWK